MTSSQLRRGALLGALALAACGGDPAPRTTAGRALWGGRALTFAFVPDPASPDPDPDPA